MRFDLWKSIANDDRFPWYVKVLAPMVIGLVIGQTLMSISVWLGPPYTQIIQAAVWLGVLVFALYNLRWIKQMQKRNIKASITMKDLVAQLDKQEEVDRNLVNMHTYKTEDGKEWPCNCERGEDHAIKAKTKLDENPSNI